MDFFLKTYFISPIIHGTGKNPGSKQLESIMSDKKRPITWTAAVATLIVAILGWATTTSNRVSALEANEVAHEKRIEKAESDANQYRNDMSEIRDRISRIEGYLKRLAQ